jgi:hypothetical protein
VIAVRAPSCNQGYFVDYRQVGSCISNELGPRIEFRNSLEQARRDSVSLV